MAGVGRRLPAYLVSRAGRVADAWGLTGEARAEIDDALRAAAAAATARMIAELEVLLAIDPADQRATPLEVVRSAVREPTAVFRAAGVGAVVRDDFDERHLPDDVYDLAPAPSATWGTPSSVRSSSRGGWRSRASCVSGPRAAPTGMPRRAPGRSLVPPGRWGPNGSG